MPRPISYAVFCLKKKSPAVPPLQPQSGLLKVKSRSKTTAIGRTRTRSQPSADEMRTTLRALHGGRAVHQQPGTSGADGRIFLFFTLRRAPRSTLFPYTTLFRSILNSFLGSSDSLVFSELFHSLAPRPLAARSISDFLLTYLAT